MGSHEASSGGSCATRSATLALLAVAVSVVALAVATGCVTASPLRWTLGTGGRSPTPSHLRRGEEAGGIGARVFQELAPMSLAELQEEAWMFQLPADGDREELARRIQSRILANLDGHSGLDATEPIQEGHRGFQAGGAALKVPSAGGIAMNETEAHERRLSGAGEQVHCTCKVGNSQDLKCVAAYFSLLLCYPNCPAACHRMGMGYQACNNSHMFKWLKRLRYKISGCEDS